MLPREEARKLLWIRHGSCSLRRFQSISSQIGKNGNHMWNVCKRTWAVGAGFQRLPWGKGSLRVVISLQPLEAYRGGREGFSCPTHLLLVPGPVKPGFWAKCEGLEILRDWDGKPLSLGYQKGTQYCGFTRQCPLYYLCGPQNLTCEQQ